MRTKISAAFAMLVAPLAFAAPAHADETSYMNELRGAGAPVFPGLESGWIGGGYRMCNELRSGVSVENVSHEVTQMDPAVYMPILQRELCPDTL